MDMSGSDDDIQLSSKKMKKTRLVLDSDEELDQPVPQIEQIGKKIKLDEAEIINENKIKTINQPQSAEKKQSQLGIEKSSTQKQKPAQSESIKQKPSQQIKKKEAKKEIESDSEEESEDDGNKILVLQNFPKVKIKKEKKLKQKSKTSPQKKIEKQTQKLEKKRTEKPQQQKAKSTTESKPINLLVNDVLKRWWYCLPSWPPENYDYSEVLMNNKLKLIDFNDWKFQPEIDSHQFQKVYQITGYPGCFKNNKGEFFDLRPRDTCPCFDNLKKKSTKELTELLYKALNNQIEDFEKSGINDPKFLSELKNQEKKVQKLVENFQNK